MMPSGLPVDLLLFIAATFVGALVTGVAGFAFGLIASAIWLTNPGQGGRSRGR